MHEFINVNKKYFKRETNQNLKIYKILFTNKKYFIYIFHRYIYILVL